MGAHRQWRIRANGGEPLLRRCRREAPPPARVTENTVLVDVDREDQDYQQGKQVSRRDQERIVLVLEQIGGGKVHTPADHFNAAIVLQHSPMTIRNDSLVAISPDNYLLGHHLATAAFEAGYAPAR